MTTLLDQLRGRALADAPRRVPWLVRVRVLLGGPFSQMGWLFFGFGLIFFWAFVCRADLTSWYRFRGPLTAAEGIVTASSDTGASEGGSKHRRGTPIYKNEFKFFVNDREYHNASYAVGVKVGARHVVKVQYPQGQPGFARIEGMRTNVFGPVALVALFFPLGGLVVIVSGLVRGVKACRLLANGIQTTGRLISKEATNVKNYGRVVYKFTFTFQSADGAAHNAIAKTEKVERFNEATAEPLVYDPTTPSWAVMLDNLPGMPHITEEGQIVVKQPWRALGLLVIPGATILGHGVYALKLLLR